MASIDGVKGILLDPRAEWSALARSVATPRSILVGHVLILATIGPLAMAIRGGASGLAPAAVSYAITVGMTFALAWVVDALAPIFGGEKDFVQSLKLTAYSYTAAWLAGIFHLLPFIGGIIGLLAALYSLYTFYLGVPVLKRCPDGSAVGYTAVVVLCAIVLGVAIGGLLMSMVFGGVMIGLAGLGIMR